MRSCRSAGRWVGSVPWAVGRSKMSSFKTSGAKLIQPFDLRYCEGTVRGTGAGEQCSVAGADRDRRGEEDADSGSNRSFVQPFGLAPYRYWPVTMVGWGC